MYLIGNLLSVCLCTLVVALDESRNAQVKQYDFQNEGLGPYKFSFESSDGIKREEEGTLAHPETDHAAVVVRGSYSYFGPDGVEYKVRYTADENGFHPEGDHIKVPPYVPWIPRDVPLKEDDNEIPVTGERILDTYQTAPPERQYVPSRPATVTPPSFRNGESVKPTGLRTFAPFKFSNSFPAFPIKQTTTYPASYDNTKTLSPFPISSTFQSAPVMLKTSYSSTLPPFPSTYLTTPRSSTIFQDSPSSPQVYLPSTPSIKPVPFVPENIEKGKELAESNQSPEIKLLEHLQSNVYLPSSTPSSVEITLHSVTPRSTDVNHS